MASVSGWQKAMNYSSSTSFAPSSNPQPTGCFREPSSRSVVARMNEFNQFVTGRVGQARTKPHLCLHREASDNVTVVNCDVTPSGWALKSNTTSDEPQVTVDGSDNMCLALGEMIRLPTAIDNAALQVQGALPSLQTQQLMLRIRPKLSVLWSQFVLATRTTPQCTWWAAASPSHRFHSLIHKQKSA